MGADGTNGIYMEEEIMPTFAGVGSEMHTYEFILKFAIQHPFLSLLVIESQFKKTSPYTLRRATPPSGKIFKRRCVKC